MRFPRHMSALDIETMFRQLPTLSSLPPVNVGSFSSHRTHVSDLPASERAKLDRVVERVLAGFRGAMHPIVGLLVVGHADQDPKGADFENKVSLERAEHVRDALAQRECQESCVRGRLHGHA
jgi:outer membrane protein OmpA-like peptidoglycan-associated protein